MTPKEKAKALYSKFYRIVDRSNSLEDMDKTTKQLCDLFITETLTSFVINLTDYQTDFWIEVQKEIEMKKQGHGMYSIDTIYMM